MSKVFMFEENVTDSPIAKVQSIDRPSSAAPDSLSRINAKPRPISARPQTNANKPSVRRIESIDMMIPKQSSRKFKIDREQLYEENLALKNQKNDNREEILKMRTKIAMLEKEITQKNETIEEFRFAGEEVPQHLLAKFHIVNGLKALIKDLREQLKAKDSQINIFKKNIKLTKIEEKNVEIQIYKEECSRLKKRLQQTLKGKNFFEGDLHKENENLRGYIKKVEEQLAKYETENKKLKTNKDKMISRDEFNKLKNELNSKNKELQEINKKINHKAKNLKISPLQNVSLFSTYTKSADIEVNDNGEIDIRPLVKRGKPPKLCVKIHKIILERGDTPRNYFISIDVNKTGSLSIKEMVKIHKSCKIKKKHVKEALFLMKQNEKGPVNLKSLEEFFLEFQYKDNSSSDDHKSYTENTILRELNVQSSINSISIFRIPKKCTLENNVSNVCIEPVATFKEIVVERSNLIEQNLSDIEKDKGNSSEEEEIQDYSKEKTLSEQSDSEDSKSDVVQDSSKKHSKSSSYSEDYHEDVSETIEHLSLILQMHRVRKEHSLAFLIHHHDHTAIISKDELTNVFKSDPLNFQETAEQLADFLFHNSSGQSSVSMKIIEDKLLEVLPAWKVLSVDDEEMFDNEIFMHIGQNREKLLEMCQQSDYEHSGEISLESFQEILNSLDLFFSEKAMNYMRLLFYSQNRKLRTVQYKAFIDIYAPEDENSLSAKKHLEILAYHLKDQPLKKVFKSKKDRISPESYYQGLKKIGFDIEDKEAIESIWEYLQKDEFISLKTFKKIMSEYDIPKDKESKSSSSESD